MTRAERDEKMAEFVRLISRLTRRGECQTCNSSGTDENRQCSDHELWEMSADDACDTVDSLVSHARLLVRELRLQEQ